MSGTVGSSGSGRLEVAGDRDWFGVSLTANLSYLVTVTGLKDTASLQIGKAADIGTDTAYGVYSSSFGTAQTWTLALTPDTTAPYYIEVSDQSTVGNYTVTVATYADDFTDNAARPGSVTVGGAGSTGRLEVVGDRDWFGVSLTANLSYVVTVTGLKNTASLQIGKAADIGTDSAYGVYNSSFGTAQTWTLALTPDTTAPYYIEVGDQSTVGNYAVTVATYADDFTDNAARPGSVTVGGAGSTGRLEVVGDRDWFGVSLTANLSYVVTVTGLKNTASLQIGKAADIGTDSAYGVYNSSFGTAQTWTLALTPDTTAPYYIEVGDQSTVGNYAVTVATYADDFTDNAARPGSVTVGGAGSTGRLEVAGDRDWFGVSLTANLSYLVTVTGLKDTASLQIGMAADIGTDLAYRVYASPSATAQTSTLVFTPDATGTYYIAVGDPSTVGNYAVTVATYADDFTDNAAHPGSVTVGGAGSTGRLEVAGDRDWFGVSLTANQSYLVTVTGLKNTASLQIGKAADIGTDLAYRVYASPSATAQTSTLVFTPDATGTYYIKVADPSTVGNYAVTVATYADDFTDNAARPGSVTANATGGNDSLVGTAGSDTLDGGAGADTIDGGAGADTIIGGIGNDLLIGGSGRDVAIFSGTKAQTTLAHNADGSWTATGPDGTDTFTGIEVARFTDGDRNLLAIPRDFTGTGTSDIVFRNTGGGLAQWQIEGLALAGGGGLYDPGPAWTIAGVADLDGDLRADILWRQNDGTLVLWRMDGLALLGGGTVAKVDTSWSVAALADFNGDGRADILWRNTNGTLAQWWMNGQALLGGGTSGTADPAWKIVAAADFDGDGKADILWRNTDGTPAIWQMDGLTLAGGGSLYNPGADWSIAGTGDFNGDGKADILWRGPGGALVQWWMDGTALIGGGGFGTVDATWKVANVSDFNGDGKADILWRNDNGALAIWQMDGLSITASANLYNPGTSWTVA